MFAATSIVTIVAPLIIVLIAPERAATVLATSRDWVVVHARTIALIALMVIGALLIAKGVDDLAA